MVVVLNHFLRKWRGLGSATSLAAGFSTTSSHPHHQQPPCALRSVGKQSSLFSHFRRDAVTIRRIVEERRWDAKLEQSLASSEIPLSDGMVVEVIKSLSEAKLALRFYVWMVQQQRDFSISSLAISVLSRRWCHEKLFNTFLRTLHLHPSSMSPNSLQILLTGYGWAGMVDKAVETLLDMPSHGIHPTSSHFVCVLNILEREKLFYSLPQVREGMRQAGIYPDAATYRKLIWGLCVAGQKEEAFSLFEEMKGEGLSPGVEAHRILISMFSKASRVMEVFRIFNELLNDGIEPDAKACNALIKAFCLDGKSQEAAEVLEMMLTKDLNPNLVSLTMVIDDLFKSGDVGKVLSLWEKVNDKSIPTVTFQDRLVLELCKSGRLAEVEKVFAGLRTKEWTASRAAYEAFILELCKVNNIDRACDCFLEMVEKLGITDAGICNDLLKKLHKIDVEMNNDLLEKLGKCDAVICNVREG